MQKIIANITYGLMVLVMLDLFIVATSMAQIVFEGRTGYWAPFWRMQAEFILNL